MAPAAHPSSRHASPCSFPRSFRRQKPSQRAIFWVLRAPSWGVGRALGYVLGDEGSGAVLGRNFLNGILKGWLPATLRDEFFAESGQTYDDIIQRVYRQPLANRYLATIVPFIHQRIDEPSLRQLVADNFEAFFRYNVLRYATPLRRMACVGGMAAPFQTILSEVASRHDFELVRVMRSPIEGLMTFHLP